MISYNKNLMPIRQITKSIHKLKRFLLTTSKSKITIMENNLPITLNFEHICIKSRMRDKIRSQKISLASAISISFYVSFSRKFLLVTLAFKKCIPFSRLDFPAPLEL